MKDFLNEDEKRYIKEKIMEPMRPDLERSLVFGSVERAKMMLESSLKRLNFGKDYEARVIFDRQNDSTFILRLQARKRDCEEFISLDFPIALRQ